MGSAFPYPCTRKWIKSKKYIKKVGRIILPCLFEYLLLSLGSRLISRIVYNGKGDYMDNINKKVGLNIKKYRRKKAWTQEMLAFEADLHRAYIGHIERGEKNIGLKNLEKIAHALSIKIESLFK